MEKENLPKNKDVDQETKEEVMKFTDELAKKLDRMNKVTKRRSRSRNIFTQVNPLIVLVTIIVGFFLLAGFLTRTTISSKISLSELVQGLESNKYAELIIQDDGSIVAHEKSFLITDEKLSGIDGPTLNVVSNSNGIEQVGIDDIADKLKTVGLVDQIRNLFNSQQGSIIQIIYLKDTTLALDGSEETVYVLDGYNRDKFNLELENRGIDLVRLGIKQKDIDIFAKELSANSIEKRIESNTVKTVIELDGLNIAILKDTEVGINEIDWTPGIFTFTEFLQNEGFDLSSGLEPFQVTTANIPQGITLDTILTVITIGGFIFLGFVIFRSAQASGMGIMQFGQSKAKMFFGRKSEVSFKDVAGIDEAREELNEIVDFLKNPNKYRKLGARIPKGILMFGPPGTGKTLLARAIAGEAGVPFFHTSGSEFEEMLVGAGASRVRDLFAKAKSAAPALIFIDEIDAVARKRGTRIQSGSTEQTLNQILVEMDGFEKNVDVIVIAATNRPDVLDRAILRPGRFDRQVRIDPPDKDGRKQILEIHARNKPLGADVDLERLAKRTVGFTGADLENIMNESAIIAAKDNRKEISMEDIDNAVSKVVLGPAKKSRKRTEAEIDLVAYHEAGHALVAKKTEGAIPVDKISIVSRGSTGGVTMFLPEKDENIISMKRLISEIRVSLGGRAAEEVVLNDISTGASNDIEKATRNARNMIQKYGMSKSLGLVQYGQSMDSQYIGYQYGDTKDFSEETAKMIDDEVRDIVNTQYQEAIKIVKENREVLDKIAAMLKEKEVLDREEFDKLFE